jgi:hypothetical protein
MPKAATVLISVIGLTLFYLGFVATLCVVLDHALARRVALLRILVSWLVPLLGAIVTIRVAVEESQPDLRSAGGYGRCGPFFLKLPQILNLPRLLICEPTRSGSCQAIL